MKGLLLAGGHGTRLRPLTFTGNKHMLPIANKPMLLYGLEQLRDAGIKDIGIVLGPIKEGVVEALGDGSSLGVELRYIDQGDPRGLADAVKVSREFLAGDSFVMYLGDNLLESGLEPMLDLFHSRGADAVVGLAKVNDPQRFGVAELKAGKLVRLVEKPEVPPSDLALIGVYVFGPRIYEAVEKIRPSWRNELEITDAIQYLIENGGEVAHQPVNGWWKDTGKPEDLLEANRLVLETKTLTVEGTIEDGVSVKGPVGVGKGSVVRRGSSLQGPLVIGENCEIRTLAKIGPYTSLGDGVEIRSGEIENSIVMQGCMLDCGRKISGSIIAKNSTILSSTSDDSGFRFVVGENTQMFL